MAHWVVDNNSIRFLTRSFMKGNVLNCRVAINISPYKQFTRLETILGENGKRKVCQESYFFYPGHHSSFSCCNIFFAFCFSCHKNLSQERGQFKYILNWDIFCFCVKEKWSDLTKFRWLLWHLKKRLVDFLHLPSLFCHRRGGKTMQLQKDEQRGSQN